MLKQFVIAIGASSGSLEALQIFFDHTLLNNASYIILRHLPPAYQSILDEVLKRHSRLKVVQAVQGASIENDIVYYAPPLYHIRIEDDTLQFVKRKGGPNRSIDTFMESLAVNENKRKSIAVILSGDGEDGVRGTAAIKKAGGLVIVQAPESCISPKLSLAVIESGNVDFVLLPQDMPNVIRTYVDRFHYID